MLTGLLLYLFAAVAHFLLTRKHLCFCFCFLFFWGARGMFLIMVNVTSSHCASETKLITTRGNVITKIFTQKFVDLLFDKEM